MLKYNINRTSLRRMIDEQVSRVADQAYANDGTSLYDAVVLTEMDDATVGRFIEEAVSAFVARNFDICKFAETDAGIDSDEIMFNVPDFDETVTDAMKNAITNYIVYFVCLELFRSRAMQVVPEYEARVLTALNKAITLLKSRKSPVGIW